MDKKLVGVIGLLAAGSAVGHEFLSWTLGKTFDALLEWGTAMNVALSWRDWLGLALMAGSFILLLSWLYDRRHERRLIALADALDALVGELTTLLSGPFRPARSMQSKIATAYAQLRRLRVPTPDEWDGSHFGGSDDLRAYSTAYGFLSAVTPPLRIEDPALVRRIAANHLRVEKQAEDQRQAALETMREEERRTLAGSMSANDQQ